MNSLCKWSNVGLLSLAMLVVSSCATAPRTQEQVMSDLKSSNPSVVLNALEDVEDKIPEKPNDLSSIQTLLTDSNAKVRRKAARVLGGMQADVTEKDIKNISALLKSDDPAEVIDGLKSLRGLKAATAVPDITPMLKHPHPNVKRDACRTLAILGDKSVIPAIEPLLESPKASVRKDAQDAIDALRKKS